jgi:hypothetical protein
MSSMYVNSNESEFIQCTHNTRVSTQMPDIVSMFKSYRETDTHTFFKSCKPIHEESVGTFKRTLCLAMTDERNLFKQFGFNRRRNTNVEKLKAEIMQADDSNISQLDDVIKYISFFVAKNICIIGRNCDYINLYENLPDPDWVVLECDSGHFKSKGILNFKEFILSKSGEMKKNVKRKTNTYLKKLDS